MNLYETATVDTMDEARALKIAKIRHALQTMKKCHKCQWRDATRVDSDLRPWCAVCRGDYYLENQLAEQRREMAQKRAHR